VQELTLDTLLARTRLLPRSFYARPTVDVARDLLGCVLVHGATAGMIVETEAYLGEGDPAAHSTRGITPRTRVVFGPPGHAYVYFIYGMYECLNIVTEPDGRPGCVLIRALEPLVGLDCMRRRRGVDQIELLTSGPGRLTLAMGITRAHYGADLTSGPLTVRRWRYPPAFSIATSARVGIREGKRLPLRFYIQGNRFVSRPGKQP
jgi:DNA-3-methyladenine glycosylase